MMPPSRFGFVPPYVIEALARCGLDEVRGAALRSVEPAQRQREARTRAASRQDGTARADGAGGARRVYDCRETFEQRVGEPVLVEGGAPGDDRDVNDAYAFAGTVRDWFAREHGRDSVDGAGIALILNVHYGVRYMNAFWDGDEMTFGDGDGRVFVGFARSLDVVAHELGHGVTQFTTGLAYRGQSGALNEHYSDVWGAAVTQAAEGATAATADWLIGDEVLAPGLAGQALRSMKAPGTAYDNDLMGTDPQPAHMRDYYAGPDDNQGVHINSGIPNRAFYLASRELETAVAARVWYRAQGGLRPDVRFEDAVRVIAQAARELEDAGGAPAGAERAVRAAFAEVGLPS